MSLVDLKQVDFLIIGFGLSGALLAWELILRGSSVVVIDDGEVNASQVAAGLINPVTGKRLAKTADIDLLLPEAQGYYAELSNFFKSSFLIEKPMLRVLRSEEEVAQCLKRLNDAAYQNYLGRFGLSRNAAGLKKTVYGYLDQKQTGYVDIRQLLTHLLGFLQSRNAYHRVCLDYQEILLDPVLSWRSFKPRKIVFCEGFRVCGNPWFSWLPMQPVKGEILTLTHEIRLPNKIINDGHWLLPISCDEVRIGATFGREKIDTQPTENGKVELLAAAMKLCPNLGRAKLNAHMAGIRPCSQDRHPLIGKHPKYTQLNIFNGFGAKGGLSLPWYCRRFADFLLWGKDLPKSSDINRYEKTHFPGC